MNSLGNILLSMHAIYITLIVSCFFVILLSDEDELHQYAINKALKLSVVLTILSLLGYSFYMLASGNKFINIHVILFGIEGLSILTLLFYYLELKGFSFTLKIKNKKITNLLSTISIIISILTTLSMIFRLKLLANPKGFIRYDELILFINFIFISFMIPISPKIKQKFTREEYKKNEIYLKKNFNIFLLIYSLFILSLIAYVIYRTVIL